jgi:5-methylcytosine-specific restriction endonuclease McrA
MTKKATNRVDMIDKIYNSWKVLNHAHTKGKIAYYNCECLECNMEYVVDGRNIRQGLSKRCTACGLRSTFKTQTGVKKSKKTSKEIAEHYLKNRIKRGRGRKNRTWSISNEQFLTLIYANCYYCNLKPSTTVNPTVNMKLQKSRALECFITYNGIDRVDSSKGYEPGNVVTCCEQCNKAKLDHSKGEFLAWANRLVSFQSSKKD